MLTWVSYNLLTFSVWPAEMGKIKADVNALPPFQCSATSCKAWNPLGSSAAAAIQSLPWTGPSLPPGGDLSFTGMRVSAASLSQVQNAHPRKAGGPIGKLVAFPKDVVPVKETRSKMGGASQTQPALNVSPSSSTLPSCLRGVPQPSLFQDPPIIPHPTKHTTLVRTGTHVPELCVSLSLPVSLLSLCLISPCLALLRLIIYQISWHIFPFAEEKLFH